MSAVALITDLFFATKVKSTADAVGIPTSIVKDAQALESAAVSGLTLVIVDLNVEGVDPIAVIRRVKNRPVDAVAQMASAPAGAATPPLVIAFASHVQADRMRAARDAGADLVVPRSRFSADLPALLTQYAGATGAR